MFYTNSVRLLPKQPGLEVSLKFVTYLRSENTGVFNVILCICINLNIYGIIHVLVHTYRVVHYPYKSSFSF